MQQAAEKIQPCSRMPSNRVDRRSAFALGDRLGEAS
jgi:hypothetical protein